jgi:energy-coupling factor transport system permease protein
VTLSEALEARGFGSSASAVPQPTRRLPLVVAIALLTVSLLAIASGRLTVGLALMAGAVFVVLRAMPQRNRRTRFRTLDWNAPSLAVAGAGVAVVAVYAALLSRAGSMLAYDPFPRLTMPPFEPLAGAVLLALLAPIFWPQR